MLEVPVFARYEPSPSAWVCAERRRKAQEGLVEGIALVAACIAAGLFQRFVGQRHQLLQKEGNCSAILDITMLCIHILTPVHCLDSKDAHFKRPRGR